MKMKIKQVFAHYQQTGPSPARFKHCPRCGTRLSLAESGHKQRPTCPDCGFVQYLNPAPTVSIAIVDQGRVLLGKRKGHPGKGTWALPSGYIAASPTLPLAERAVFGIERDLAKGRTDMPGALFLSVGGRESTEMRQAMADLNAVLRKHAYPGLAIHTLVRCGRGHGGNNWQSYIDGVRWMHKRGIL